MEKEKETLDLFRPEIARFIRGNKLTPGSVPRSRWMYHCEEQEVYLRLGKKIIEGQIIDLIQIANIRTEEENQRKGIFTGFLKWLEQFDMGIYVENTHNPDLARFLLKIGFKQNQSLDHEFDYYRLKNNSNE